MNGFGSLDYCLDKKTAGRYIIDRRLSVIKHQETIWRCPSEAIIRLHPSVGMQTGQYQIDAQVRKDDGEKTHC
jgi:hypothetical protein